MDSLPGAFCLLERLSSDISSWTGMEVDILRIHGCMFHRMIVEGCSVRKGCDRSGKIDRCAEPKLEDGPWRLTFMKPRAANKDMVGFLSGAVCRSIVEVAVPVVEGLGTVSRLDDVDKLGSVDHGNGCKKRKRASADPETCKTDVQVTMWGDMSAHRPRSQDGT